MTKSEKYNTDEIRVTAIVRKEEKNEHFYRYEGLGVDGEKCVALVPREAGADLTRRELRKRGFKLSKGQSAFELTDIIEETLPVLVEAAQVGFREGCKTFVGFDKVFCADKSRQKYLPPSRENNAIMRRIEQVGSVDEFRSKMAPVIEWSDVLILSAATAFGSPLLSLLNVPSFGFVFYGPSRTGKSTAQLVSASIIGIGDAEHMLTLNATDIGLGEAACKFRDHVMCINELGTAQGGKDGIYEAVFKSTYQLMSGTDRLRHSSFTADKGSIGNEISSIFVFSSEHSPDEWASYCGKFREEGEKSRLIGIPVLDKKGQFSIFNKPPTKLKRKAKEEWASKQLSAIHKLAPIVRGAAFAAFVDKVTCDPKASLSRARYYVEQFKNRRLFSDYDRVRSQIVSHFAVLYAGAALAAEFKILPISKKRIRQALVARLLASIEALPSQEQALQSSRSKLRRKIQWLHGRKKLRMKNGDNLGYVSRDIENGGATVVISIDRFCKWFRDRAAANALLEWLEEKGYLRSGTQAQRGKGGKGLKWATSQPSWPDKTRPRSIVLHLPKWLDSL